MYIYLFIYIYNKYMHVVPPPAMLAAEPARGVGSSVMKINRYR